MGKHEEKQELLEELAETSSDVHRLLKIASEELLDDPEVLSAAVKVDGAGLRFASAAMRDNAALVLLAVKSDARALRHASKRCQGDREIVLAAVTKDGEALQYASEELRGDRGIVLAAAQSNTNCLAYAPAHFLEDTDVRTLVEAEELETFLKSCTEAAAASPTTTKGIKASVEAVWGFRKGSVALRSNRAAVQAALPLDSKILSFVADPALLADRALVLEAVQNYGEALMYANVELKADKELQQVASKTFLDLERDCGDPDGVIAAVKADYRMVSKAAKQLKTDQDFILRAARAVEDSWANQEKLLVKRYWRELFEDQLLSKERGYSSAAIQQRSKVNADELLWILLKQATRNGLKMPSYKHLVASPLGVAGDGFAPSLVLRCHKASSSSSSVTSGSGSIDFETCLLSGQELRGSVGVEASLEDLAKEVLRLVREHVKDAKRVILAIQSSKTRRNETDPNGDEVSLLSPFAGTRRLADFLS